MDWRRLVEALVVGAMAFALALVVFSRCQLLGLALGPPTAVVAGANGVVSGATGIYAWHRGRGWVAFALDSTWALLGTALGLLLHVANLASRRPGYIPEMCRRANMHIYQDGFGLRPDFALASGNVISNAGGKVGLRGESDLVVRRRRFVVAHEGVHVFQSRLFGPLYQAIYFAWMIGASVVAVIVWLLRERKNLGKIVETLAYYDNPFEYWAYRSDNYWPPEPALKKYTWRG